MKNILLTAMVVGIMSCGGNAEGSGDEGKNMGERPEAVENTPQGQMSTDTTATTNNNAYNTDSSSGQSTTYDTSSNNKDKQKQ